jgi:hypothetical protein
MVEEHATGALVYHELWSIRVIPQKNEDLGEKFYG